jgi:hypothetical protein
MRTTRKSPTGRRWGSTVLLSEESSSEGATHNPSACSLALHYRAASSDRVLKICLKCVGGWRDANERREPPIKSADSRESR